MRCHPYLIGLAAFTVMLAVPAVARFAVGTAAVREEPETKVVASAVPFHSTLEVEMNPEPVTVRLKPVAPTWTEAGETPLSTGAGLVMLKLSALEEPPPGVGFTTVMLAVPAAARLAVETTAVSEEAETKVVGSIVPFHSTWDVETNPEPVTVRLVAAEPTGTEVGARDETLGIGLLLEPPVELPLPPPQPMTAPIRTTEAYEMNLTAEGRIFTNKLLKRRAG